MQAHAGKQNEQYLLGAGAECLFSSACGGLTSTSSQTPIQPLAHPPLLKNRDKIEGR